jgi:hypothetical protein
MIFRCDRNGAFKVRKSPGFGVQATDCRLSPFQMRKLGTATFATIIQGAGEEKHVKPIGLTCLGLAAAALLYWGSVHGKAGIFGVAAHPGGSNDGSNGPRRLILAFDRSGSYRACLPGALHLGCELAGRLDPDRSRVTCIALDTQPHDMFDNAPPDTEEALADLLEDYLGRKPAANGTAPSRLWTRIAEACEHEKARVAIAFYTDGDVDTPDTWKALTLSAERLAKLPQVAFVGIYGVTPENRTRLNDAFHDFDHSRFRLYGTGETDTEELLLRLQEDRTAPKETHIP